MKKILLVLTFLSFLECHLISAQPPVLNKKQFFTDTSIIDATLTTNIASLFKQSSKKGKLFPAKFSITGADSSVISEPVMLEVRGNFRRDYCYIPPLKIRFKSAASSTMRSLGTLKLVNQCNIHTVDDQNLLKEFLVYRIYNLLTDMSFQVRLLNLRLVDSANKKKPIVQHAFFIEDIKALAQRNNCAEKKNVRMNTEATDRKQMTLVAIFQYMIGNTDWSVPVSHNTRLIASKTDSFRRPYVVPYDFDYSGFVNAGYAIPDEILDIKSVRQRVYRGFPRTMEELNEALDIFKREKQNIYALVNNFGLLNARTKKEITSYLDEFYDIADDPKMINSVFIKGARTE